MRPVLLELMGWKLPAYGTTLVLVFLSGLLVVWHRVRPLGVSTTQMLDIAGISAGIILLWVALGIALSKAGLLHTPALNAFPILAIGAFAVLAYLRRQKLPAERIFDAIAPVAACCLGLQYGIGTFLAGTAYGRPTDLPWGISFPPESAAFRVYGDAALHPTQLYLGVLLFAIGVTAEKLRRDAIPGQRALLTFAAMSIAYLAISPLRGNTTSFLAGEPIRLSEIAVIFTLAFCSYMASRLRSASFRPGMGQRSDAGD